MTTRKTIAFTRGIFVSKVRSLFFNMLSRLVIAFLPRSKSLLISWLQSPSAVILEPRKIKSLTVSIVSPSICYEVMALDAMIFTFWMLSFKPAFTFSPFTFIKEAFWFLFTFCRKGGVICFSEVIDISPSSLDSSLFFIQPWCIMYSAYKLNKQSDNIQPWCTPFPILNLSIVENINNKKIINSHLYFLKLRHKDKLSLKILSGEIFVFKILSFMF